MSDDIETKLSAARTRLILDKPFLGALVLRLPMKAGDPKWCKSTATDARTLYYNPEYISELSLDQTQFVLAHEAMHCALSHFARRQHRDKHRWDVACDFAINPLLISDGLKPTPDALVLQEYDGMTAEEIYPLLDENPEQEPHDQHLYDESESDGEGNQPPPPASPDQPPPPENNNAPQSGQEPDDGDGDGSGEQSSSGSDSGGDHDQQAQPDQADGGASQPPPLTESERAALAVQWQQRLAGAAQQAMQAGKLGGALARLVDHLLQPQLPWRMLLARYMTSIARDDYSYSRPSSRREGDAIMPSLRSAQTDLVVALDTSGSIGEKEISEFVSEVNAIKGQMRARITVLACDAELAEDGPWEFEPWEEIELPDTLHGGGGTDFQPVFDWTRNRDRQPDLLVYFTDAEGEFPKLEPHFPVVWLVKGKLPTPWGTRIQLN
ncbi:MAG: VWA-like domain-containing protein [Acidiferrobacterales bacterium]|jgi:predicted metal-dependent peptidase|nr:VWA-like domain-containing protein [Acidiferrobacterales bacterium]